MVQLLLHLFCGLRIHYLREVPEYDISGSIPGGDAGAASLVVRSRCQPPTISGCSQGVVTGKTIQLCVFWPVRAESAAAHSLQRLVQLHRLTDRPLLHAKPWGIALAIGFPVPRHGRTEGIEFEGQIGMAGGDHLVIDLLISSTHMASQALFRPFDEIAGIVHSQFVDRGFVLPVLGGVITEPTGSRPMTILATHSIVK